MKVIFLDIDGVLNSVEYDRRRKETDPNIDETALERLCLAVEKTGAKIVLTSSWRKGWDEKAEKRTKDGEELHALFLKHGVEIYGKTPVLEKVYDRKDEIQLYLEENPSVEKFVIVDDILFGWGELSDFLVRTTALSGGLQPSHVQKIIELLS